MDLWTRLSKTEKPIVLYGMGNGADKILNIMEKRGIKASGVFASDGFVRPKRFHGMPIMSYSDAKMNFGDMVVLVSFGTSLPDVLDNIKSIASEQELYVPDVPVAGDGLFDIEFARKHRAELEQVYGALYDKRDRAVFKNLVEYKLSGDPARLYVTAGDEDELYKLISPGDNGVYMDCGAFNGDTVGAYLRHVRSYKKIYAVEPDPRSYRKMQIALDGMENICLVNSPLSYIEQSAFFSDIGSRGSRLSAEGTYVLTRTIDGILDGERVDYIKIDVEGEESAVLDGAVETIRVYAPKLLVSCYHRVEDIFSIPLQVLAMNKNYKLHLWHPIYLPPWDASYIFV